MLGADQVNVLVGVVDMSGFDVILEAVDEFVDDAVRDTEEIHYSAEHAQRELRILILTLQVHVMRILATYFKIRTMKLDGATLNAIGPYITRMEDQYADVGHTYAKVQHVLVACC